MRSDAYTAVIVVICEIRVHIRPIVGIGAFAAAVGPPLARKRGPIRANIVRLMGPGLKGLFALVDVVSTRPIKSRSSRPRKAET